MHTLNLVATDDAGLTGTARLVITVADVNDNAPQFASDLYEGSLEENSMIFSSPITVQVSHEWKTRQIKIDKQFQVLQ